MGGLNPAQTMSFSSQNLGLLLVIPVIALAISCAGAEQPSTSDQSGGQPKQAAEAAGDTATDASSTQLLERKITRTATLTLAVEDVGGAIQKIDSIATTAGGFVSESNVVMAQGTDGQTKSQNQTGAVT